ncbi:hypothetical protein [Amaricoccus macauensis]|uniref:hypothetical protein n=1 Tax=Amaricoccus macauensis TaxID=57001 RepID=UPI003C7A08CE
MKPKQLRQLTALAEARRSRDLAALEAAMNEDRRLAQAIDHYAKSPALDLREDGGAFQFNQMALRQQWADRNIALARQQRVELAKRIAGLRKKAASSLGKHEALEKLTEQANKSQAETERTRTEREAPVPQPQKGWGETY